MSEEMMALIAKGTGETLLMTFLSGLFGFVIGLPAGIVLFLTRSGQVLEHRPVNKALSFFVNVFRSIPFIILIVWMIPFTRALVGTSIGIQAALVPLSVGAAPFIARMVENSLTEVPAGLIEAARAMGATPLQIVTKVLLPEALPSLVNCATITLIALVGYSAMGGAVGAGGLGQIGYQYGFIGSVKKTLKGECDASPCALLPKELISLWVTHSVHERSNSYQENLTKKNSQQKF